MLVVIVFFLRQNRMIDIVRYENNINKFLYNVVSIFKVLMKYVVKRFQNKYRY